MLVSWVSHTLAHMFNKSEKIYCGAPAEIRAKYETFFDGPSLEGHIQYYWLIIQKPAVILNYVQVYTL